MQDLLSDSRFWAKVNKHGPTPKPNPKLGRCWVWTGALSAGYGHLRRNSKYWLAHRFSWFLTKGSLPPKGWDLDHLCRVPACVRVSHLEPVTHQENNMRGKPRKRDVTHCEHGHQFTSENTVVSSQQRRCRICLNAYRRGLRHRRRLGCPIGPAGRPPV